MKANIDTLGGLIYSQKVMLALINKGLSREDAYKIVQDNAMAVWDGGCQDQFIDLLEKDNRVMDILTKNDLTDLFNPQDYLTHCGEIIDNAIK
jgi:adenylosuccinate lyase